MKTIAQKINQLEGLMETKDLTMWEGNFVGKMVDHLIEHGDTKNLTSRQVEVIDEIWERHFA